MPFLITDDGIELYYEVHGQGPAVAFASGFMGITDIWKAQFEALSNRYTCIAFDNRGAGRSEKPLPRIAYGVERHARDLHAVLTHLGMDDRVVVVGHSMGGNTACQYTLDHPEQVAGFVPIGSYLAGRQILEAGNSLEAIEAAVTRKSARVAFYEAVGLSTEVAMESTKWELYALMGNARSFMAFDASERIGRIRCPALVIHGDRDIVSPLDPCGLSLRDGLKDSRLEVIEDTNHCPMSEKPDRVNALLADFLEKRVRWSPAIDPND
jgi:pimeloyl-ACP methyl ester carboxylesterase